MLKIIAAYYFNCWVLKRFIIVGAYLLYFFQLEMSLICLSVRKSGRFPPTDMEKNQNWFLSFLTEIFKNSHYLITGPLVYLVKYFINVYVINNIRKSNLHQLEILNALKIKGPLKYLDMEPDY